MECQSKIISIREENNEKAYLKEIEKLDIDSIKKRFLCISRSVDRVDINSLHC